MCIKSEWIHSDLINKSYSFVYRLSVDFKWSSSYVKFKYPFIVWYWIDTELMILQNTKNQIITYSFQIHSVCDEMWITGMTTMIRMYTHKKNWKTICAFFIVAFLCLFFVPLWLNAMRLCILPCYKFMGGGRSS